MSEYRPFADVPDWLHKIMTTWGEVVVYREDSGGTFPKTLQTRAERRNPGSKMPNAQLEYIAAGCVLAHQLTPLAIRHLLEDRYHYAARGYTRPTWESVQAYFGSQHMREDTAKVVAGWWEGALDAWVKRTLPEIRKDAGAGLGGMPEVDEGAAGPKPKGQRAESAAVEVVSEAEKRRLMERARP